MAGMRPHLVPGAVATNSAARAASASSSLRQSRIAATQIWMICAPPSCAS